MGTFSIWHWLVVLVIVVLVFGTKKLRNLGGDLGSAIKGFKEGMKDASSETDNNETKTSNTANLTFDEEVKHASTTTNTFKENVQSQETANATTAATTSANKETITVEATPVKEEEALKRETAHVSSEPAATESKQTKS